MQERKKHGGDHQKLPGFSVGFRHIRVSSKENFSKLPLSHGFEGRQRLAVVIFKAVKPT